MYKKCALRTKKPGVKGLSAHLFLHVYPLVSVVYEQQTQHPPRGGVPQGGILCTIFGAKSSLPEPGAWSRFRGKYRLFLQPRAVAKAAPPPSPRSDRTCQRNQIRAATTGCRGCTRSSRRDPRATSLHQSSSTVPKAPEPCRHC